MAAHQLPLLSFSFSKMVPLQRKPPSPETNNFVVLSTPIQRGALTSDNQTNLRRSANYKPSIWHDDYIQSLSSEFKEEIYVKKNKVLKEEVWMILCKLVDHVDQLDMIDVLQRLGVSYHFDNEIRNILQNVHNNMDALERKKNLHVTALAFRLLRQHGFNISIDVFVNFQDTMGKFNKCLSVDVKGLLSLYEASFYSMENEPILDEARDFTIKFLKEFLNTNRDSDTSLLINHALEFPLQWRVQRWEALWFIKFLCERRKNTSRALLQFAELDFNLVQSIHQEELKYTSRWWKRVGLFGELSFFRDRLVENFIWGMGMNFEPDHGNLRKVVAMTVSFITMIDDIYDVYGTLEELELFTEAVDSWDLNAMDSLPHYMKICFLALYNFVNEVAFVSLKENGYNIVPNLKKAWADLCKSYFVEAKWYHSRYTPRLEEYMENAWITTSVPAVLMHAYFLIPTPFKKEDLDRLEEYPNIIRYPAVILRLADDLGTCKKSKPCGGSKFQYVENTIVCHDYQEIKIQESTQVLGVGAIPCSILVILKDDLVDGVKAGDDVIVTGLLTARWSPELKDVRCDLDPELIGNNVLELDSRNVKALYRRAQAYIQLVNLDLAEMDIKKALEIEPDNRDVKIEYKILKEKVREYKKKDAQFYGSIFAIAEWSCVALVQ